MAEGFDEKATFYFLLVAFAFTAIVLGLIGWGMWALATKFGLSGWIGLVVESVAVLVWLLVFCMEGGGASTRTSNTRKHDEL